MPRIVKNTLLNYIPTNFVIEKAINPARIFELNNKPVKNGKIIYLCEREVRAKDNFALQFALQNSKELNLPLKIIHPKIYYEYNPKQKFIDSQIAQAEKQFKNIGLDFEVIEKTPAEIIKSLKPALIILDFNPILKRDYLKNADFKIYEVDGHNIIPARFVSDKQEYSAATLRRKIYYNIYPFLTEFDNLTTEKVEADYVLEDFIKNKLPHYAEYKNDMSKNVLSGLSKYLNLGFISSQRVALEVIKSGVKDINKEVFLEELIVRKELADNFCLYSKNYKDFTSIPNWAKVSLENHMYDIRPYIYSPEELENAKSDEDNEAIIEKFLLDDLKFVFDSTKLGIPVYYQVYYAMQVAVWEVVIAGGLVCGLNLSAELLQKSLIANKEKEEDYYITNKERIQELKDNVIIQSKIKELLEKYSKHKLSVDINENNIKHDELLLHFEGGDLLYSLHDATINIKGQKIDNKWHLHIVIKDKYDFTNPNLKKKEYEQSPLASILNNCGVVSQQYGVIRPYYVYAEFEYANFYKEVTLK